MTAFTAALFDWLADHHGVISRSDLERFDVTDNQLRHLVRTDQLTSDGRGAFRLGGAPRTADQAAALVQSAFERGLLLLTAGTRAVRICPPLVIDRDEAATALEIITAALD